MLQTVRSTRGMAAPPALVAEAVDNVPCDGGTAFELMVASTPANAAAAWRLSDIGPVFAFRRALSGTVP